MSKLREELNLLFDDGRISHANDKAPNVCKQYIDRAEAVILSWLDKEVIGEDEGVFLRYSDMKPKKTLINRDRRTRDKLRAEMRKKLGL